MFGDTSVSHPSLVPLGLGLSGFVLCFFLPHIQGSVDMVAHVTAAALAVLALGITMSDEAKRRPRG